VRERTAELEATQDALRHAQKMEALGQLTGGIAHDFNNLLAGISGSLELMAARLARGRTAEVGRYIETAQGAARRAAALTHRLLAFSRRQTLNPVVADVGALCRGMEDLLRRSIGPSIEMSVEAAPDAWPIMIDDHQLENALLNLVINARDAMPAGGRLAIRIANRRLDDDQAEGLDVAPGDYVVLSIADTGTGMAPDVIARAIDPFFTTKPTGQGTGLGLSMVYGFVRQSGGQLTIDSALEVGTTVELYLPRHHGPGPTAAPVNGVGARPLNGDGRCALIVDDEPSVLLLITDVLRGAGYATMEAADSASAMKVIESGATIDLLISDVGLPGGLNGRQLADAAVARRPDLKVLLVTGYAEASTLDPDPHQAVLRRGPDDTRPGGDGRRR
jgi:nitrogen-specific signal transduction histidine kinase/CheY-like chemotaxis protein